jgi:MOSC domain-containing protein YiiM
MLGRVASLHVHPPVAGDPFLDAPEFNLVAEKGIVEDKRYFGRVNYGKPAKRQVTLIEREMIDQHAAALGAQLDPGDVRSNIETTGVDLISLIGQQVQIGEAVLLFVEPRTPCHKMDALAPGLRALMENSRQGVIARVVKSGRIRPGDSIQPAAIELTTQPAAANPNTPVTNVTAP